MSPKREPSHDWTWTGQSERYYFGDPSKPYPVDHWKCQNCGKETSSRGNGDGPASGKCRAVQHTGEEP